MNSTNTIENDVKNTQPKKYKFAEAFGNILSFPFRLAFYVYKYTIRMVSIILFIGLIAIAIRSAYPMELPEAHGVTYYQFLSERINAFNKFADNKKITGIYKIGFTSTEFVLYPIAYDGIFPLIFPRLYPNSQFSKWISKNMNSGGNYSYILPRGEAKWENISGLVWESVERSSWEWFVILGSHPTIRNSDYIPYPQYSTGK
jgi:hypothetical protein